MSPQGPRGSRTEAAASYRAPPSIPDPVRTLLLVCLVLPTVAYGQGERALDTLRAADYDAVVAQLRAGKTDVDYQRGRLAVALTPGYNPYAVEAKQQERRLTDHLFEHDDPAAALAVADSLFADDYLNLVAHHRAGLAHERLGDADQAAFHAAVFQGLLDSILRTATGTEDDPFVVNRVTEEYVVIGVLGLEMLGQTLVGCAETRCDAMDLRDPRDNGEVTLYFDISIPYGHMRRQMNR